MSADFWIEFLQAVVRFHGGVPKTAAGAGTSSPSAPFSASHSGDEYRPQPGRTPPHDQDKKRRDKK